MNRQTEVSPGSQPSCWNCGFRARARRLMTVDDVMRFCGVSRTAVYEWMARGRVEWVYTAGGKRRIFQDSLLRSSEKS